MQRREISAKRYLPYFEWVGIDIHTHTNTPIYLDRKNSKVYTRFIRTYRGPLMILFCFLFHFVVHNNKRYYMGICLSHPTEVSRCVYRTHTYTHSSYKKWRKGVVQNNIHTHTQTYIDIQTWDTAETRAEQSNEYVENKKIVHILCGSCKSSIASRTVS